MKILQAIAAADRLRPNEVPGHIKLSWLSALDGQLQTELYDTHTDGPERFAGYDEQTDAEATDLRVPAPYDELYVWFLLMRIDLLDNDIQRYNNDAEIFGARLTQYQQHYHRQHMPKSVDALQF